MPEQRPSEYNSTVECQVSNGTTGISTRTQSTGAWTINSNKWIRSLERTCHNIGNRFSLFRSPSIRCDVQLLVLTHRIKTTGTQQKHSALTDCEGVSERVPHTKKCVFLYIFFLFGWDRCRFAHYTHSFVQNSTESFFFSHHSFIQNAFLLYT